MASGWLVGPPVASDAPGRRGTRHARERCTARRRVSWLSRDRAVRDHLEKSRSHLRWCVSLPAVAPAKMFQVSSLPMLQRLFEAVRGAHYGTGRHRPRLTRSEEENRPGDVTLALAHHARHQPRRLKPSEPLLGGPGVQTTVGMIDGNQGIPICAHTWSSRRSCEKGLTSVPTLGERFASVLLMIIIHCCQSSTDK